MQKQPIVQKLTIAATASLLSFSITQAFAAPTAALKLSTDRPIITMLPGDGGNVVQLSSLDAMGNPATLLQEQTVSVMGGGVFGNVTKSALFPKGLATVQFPVGGSSGFFKPTNLGVGTLQAAFANSSTTLQSNTLEIQVTNGQTIVEDDDILPFEMNSKFEFNSNSLLKIRGGFSINGGKRLAYGKAKRGERINARFKIAVNPTHQNKPGRFFTLLMLHTPNQPNLWFDLGTWQLWSGSIDSLGTWGGPTRIGQIQTSLLSEIELFDFDDSVQNIFFQQFPPGTAFMLVGGYKLDGESQLYLGALPLNIE